jgi:sugar fermentation stimulation protein A
MEHALYFTPNRKTHPQFADALCEAKNAGVKLLAYTCNVMPDELKINSELKIRL